MTRRIVVGMHHINVTQCQFCPTGLSHKYIPAVDLAGEDTGMDYWRAMDGAYKCIGTWGTAHGTAFAPIDSNGNYEMTELADGTIRYLAIYLVHDNNAHKVGTVIPKGEVMYTEGSYANGKTGQVGNHIHCEAFVFDPNDIKLDRIQAQDGQWYFRNYIEPSELWIATDYSTIVALNGQNFGRTILADTQPDVPVTPTPEPSNPTTSNFTQINAQGGSNSLRDVTTSFHVYAKNNTVPSMEVVKQTYEGSDIYALKIKLDENTVLLNDYRPDGCAVENATNDYMINHDYYEVAAWNGGYFEMSGTNAHKPVGAVLTDWSGAWAKYKTDDCVPAANNGYPTLAWDDSKMYLLNLNADQIDTKAYHWLNGVGQSEVIDYKVNCGIGSENGRYYQKNMCMSMGFDSKTNTVIAMLNITAGLDTLQKAYVMQGLGCELGVQLDGGNSSLLRYRNDLQSNDEEKALDAQIAQLQANVASLTEQKGKYTTAIETASNTLKNAL